MLKRRLDAAPAIMAILLLAACSTTSDHTDVLTSFADSTAKASLSLEAYDTAAAGYMTSFMKRRALEAAEAGNADLIGPVLDDCIARRSDSDVTPRCRVGLMADSEDLKGVPIVYTTIIPNYIAVANEIAAYATALNNLAKADSRPQVAVALDKIAATATGIAAAAYPMGGGPAVAAIANPTASALSWSYGKYQEQTKIDALRKATQAVDPLIQDVAAKFSDVGLFVEDVHEGELQKAVVLARLEWLKNGDERHLDDYLSKADALDKQLAAGPAKVFADMGKAHRKLTDSLQHNITSFADAQVAIDRLADDAEAVFKIAQGFKKAADAK